MRYISDDNKVFNTEQECCEYEQNMKSQRIQKEQLERERQDKLCDINKKYEELQKLLSEYEKDYGVKQMPYVAPFYEILDMLCG
ncbi:hypothetical protein NSB25_27930 [Acetatifactor muris]|uniref:Uncharacterized protein n=1 Tax=Acetatifactor muris TaxID=879566 RepID=A0A2K4ZQH0_9FIRM|nr:hypothetical protein [Acetatifactor muris]MCR2051050.1 hypothetical protein [Acetatifactor muris]SOY32582.1 hypothetical protein AMURIS_05347 [Acetatifactor muris]